MVLYVLVLFVLMIPVSTTIVRSLHRSRQMGKHQPGLPLYLVISVWATSSIFWVHLLQRTGEDIKSESSKSREIRPKTLPLILFYLPLAQPQFLFTLISLSNSDRRFSSPARSPRLSRVVSAPPHRPQTRDFLSFANFLSGTDTETAGLTPEL